MPIPHKLDQPKEREICLAFLCGVDSEYLCQRYEVSDATIKANIVGNYSPRWNDPLVEFYRKAPAKERLHNSAHLYLAVNKSDVFQKELVDWSRDQQVYKAVAANIYDPLIGRVEQLTSLAGYLGDESGMEKLLKTINPDWRNSGKMVEHLLIERLYQEYQQKGSSEFSLDNVQRDIAKTIFHKVKYGGLALTPKKAEFVREALGMLTEREQGIISLRFGLSDEKAKSLEQVAQAKQEKVKLFCCDDLDARDTAITLGFSVHGTLGLVLRSFRENKMSREEVFDIINDLATKSSLFLTSDLLAWIRKEVEQYSEGPQ